MASTAHAKEMIFQSEIEAAKCHLRRVWKPKGKIFSFPPPESDFYLSKEGYKAQLHHWSTQIVKAMAEAENFAKATFGETTSLLRAHDEFQEVNSRCLTAVDRSIEFMNDATTSCYIYHMRFLDVKQDLVGLLVASKQLVTNWKQQIADKKSQQW